jgi:DNA-binding NtrC family response regulator
MSLPVILCVDDEINILKSLERCLSTENIEVLTSSSGREALLTLQARGKEIKVLIVDQKMPEMTGEELLERVRYHFPLLPVIMLSGYADLESLIRVISNGDLAYFIAKPWSNQELIGLIRKILGESVLIKREGTEK